jgi:hypothetical protein
MGLLLDAGVDRRGRLLGGRERQDTEALIVGVTSGSRWICAGGHGQAFSLGGADCDTLKPLADCKD